MNAHRIAVYPGTFDPFTSGHFSIVRRGSALFDTVIVAVAKDNSKNTLFSLEDRVRMTQESLAEFPTVKVEPFSGLLVDYVRSVGACAILRGLRAVSDFDYEIQMALMNRKLCSDVQTLFLMSDFSWMYISSTMIRGVASLGGNVRGMVPDGVLPYLRKAYGLPESWPELQPARIPSGEDA